MVLVCLFLFGYIAFLYLCLSGRSHLDPLVCVIFFGGGIFVLTVSRISERTVDDIKRVRRLERESQTDGLTSLYNRRYLDQRLFREVARAQLDSAELCVLSIDVDHFKWINDQHGHLAGDRVLQELARRIASSCRATDVVARYGGEEIAVLMPNTNATGATDAAERIRRAVSDAPFPVSGSDVQLRCTVSVGLAALDPTRDEAPTSLLDRADAALYEAKRSGRNRVIASRSQLSSQYAAVAGSPAANAATLTR